ncbi:MAG: class I SAM-dependent methyltransferase [Pseudomonadota bacterium]
MSKFELPIDIDSVKGFLDAAEGDRLYDLALKVSPELPVLEIGSYCGKSTVYLGAGAKQGGGQVFALDHHRGSEEHQLGEEYHDSELFDAELQRMDTLPLFRRTLALAGLEEVVIPVVASTAQAGRFWEQSLGLVFIDGGHSLAAALADYRTWVPHIVKGGFLAIHDIFPDPNDGGQAPYEIYKLAQASGLFEDLGLTKTLAVLQRL